MRIVRLRLENRVGKDRLRINIEIIVCKNYDMFSRFGMLPKYFRRTDWRREDRPTDRRGLLA